MKRTNSVLTQSDAESCNLHAASLLTERQTESRLNAAQCS